MAAAAEIFDKSCRAVTEQLNYGPLRFVELVVWSPDSPVACPDHARQGPWNKNTIGDFAVLHRHCVQNHCHGGLREIASTEFHAICERVRPVTVT